MPADSDGRAPAAGAWRQTLRWRRVFPGEARQLAALRRFLAVLLPECTARDDVMSVATELGSNAILHTASGQDGRFAVEIAWDAAAVHVAVGDGGAASGPRVVEDPQQEGGRGLLLVRGLSRTCGVCGDQRGRVVWADVPWADPEAVALGRRVAAVGDGGEILGGAPADVPGWLGRPSRRAGWQVAPNQPRSCPGPVRAGARAAARQRCGRGPDSEAKDCMTDHVRGSSAGRAPWPRACWPWASSTRPGATSSRHPETAATGPSTLACRSSIPAATGGEHSGACQAAVPRP